VLPVCLHLLREVGSLASDDAPPKLKYVFLLFLYVFTRNRAALARLNPVWRITLDLEYNIGEDMVIYAMPAKDVVDGFDVRKKRVWAKGRALRDTDLQMSCVSQDIFDANRLDAAGEIWPEPA